MPLADKKAAQCRRMPDDARCTVRTRKIAALKGAPLESISRDAGRGGRGTTEDLLFSRCQMLRGEFKDAMADKNLLPIRGRHSHSNKHIKSRAAG